MGIQVIIILFYWKASFISHIGRSSFSMHHHDLGTRILGIFFLKLYPMLNSHCNVMLLHYEKLFIGVFQKLVTNWFGFCLLKDDTGDNTAGKKMINTRQKAGDFHSLLKDVIGLIGSHFPVCIDFIPRTRMSELFLWLDSITNFTSFC